MKKNLLIALTLLLPLSASAQFARSGIMGLIDSFANIIDILIPLTAALALLYFFWGLTSFIKNSAESQEEGKQIMTWGIIALFVIFSIWGIVEFIQRDLGIFYIDTINP